MINKHATCDSRPIFSLSFQSTPLQALTYRVLFVIVLFTVAIKGVGANNLNNLLTEEDRAYLKQLGPITMCIDPDWKPFEYIDENQQFSGISADLMNLISKRTGIEFKLIKTKDWDESLQRSIKGDCMILTFLNQTTDREKWLLFTNEFFTDYNVFITREEHEFIPNPAVLSGKTIALPRGTSIEERVRGDYPNLKIILFDSEAEAIKAVNDRVADMTLRSLTMAAYIIKTEGWFNLKIAGQLPDYTNKLKIGVSKEYPLLRNILNKAIATLTDQDIQNAVNNHVSIKIVTGADYTVIIRIGIALLIVLLVGLVWNYQLRRLNHKLALNEKELINLSEKLKKDIEARKKIGAILKSRDRQLVNLISNLPGFVYRCQNDDYYTMEFISDGCFDITGYQSRDFINNRRIAFSDIILHEELPMIKEKWGIALQKREHFEHEYRITNADETIHWVWERGYCVLDSDGKLTALEGFITDITAQKLAEEKLRNLFENAPVGIFHSVPAGQFITANPPLAKMLGYSSPEELVERISDMTTQIYADPNLRIDQMEKLMKTDGWVHREDVMWRRKDGNLINVDMTGRKVLNPDGSIAYLEGFIEDITEQKKAEMLLRNSEEKYRLITNYASDVIWVLNLERLKYTFISPSIIYLRGFSVEEAMAQSSDESLTTESAISVRNLIAERIQYFIQDPNKEIFYIDEIQQPCKDGRIIWVEVSTKFKYNNVGEIEIIGVSRNIDQRKHFEKELQQNAAQLSELNATKDKFFSIIAHDLKSPFNSIMGFSQLLVEQVNLKDYERLGEFAGIILHSSEKAVSLLMNLMEWSRSQTGRMQFNPKRFDLTDFIKEVTLPFDAIAGQKGIVIKRGLPLNVPVFADKAMLGTVLRNLISNAIKFTNPGGGINLSVTVEKEKLTFSLTDNGIGIPKDAINKIFQFDGNYSTRGTANETGTGLGLILCKEFVEKHNGEIGVESEQGKGSTFRFTLPYNPEPIKNTTDLQPAPSGKIETARKLKILIAEDDEVSEKLIDINVKMISRDILKARTGVEAVEVCRNNPDIDLILMDIRMPEMDGYEATQLIREFNNEVVIIVQTAHGLSGDREKALESGCNDYISKPINKAELLAMISKHCLK